MTDTRDMVLVHRVFRREFGLLPLMVRGVADGDVRAAARVARHAREMTDALHHHHHNEDELLWPRLLERAPLDADLVNRMEAQHAALAEILRRVEMDFDTIPEAKSSSPSSRKTSGPPARTPPPCPEPRRPGSSSPPRPDNRRPESSSPHLPNNAGPGSSGPHRRALTRSCVRPGARDGPRPTRTTRPGSAADGTRTTRSAPTRRTSAPATPAR